jgi:hypothetical protein
MSTSNTVSTPRARSRAPGIASRLFNHVVLLVAGTRLVLLVRGRFVGFLMRSDPVHSRRDEPSPAASG